MAIRQVATARARLLSSSAGPNANGPVGSKAVNQRRGPRSANGERRASQRCIQSGSQRPNISAGTDRMNDGPTPTFRRPQVLPDRRANTAAWRVEKLDDDGGSTGSTIFSGGDAPDSEHPFATPTANYGAFDEIARSPDLTSLDGRTQPGHRLAACSSELIEIIGVPNPGDRTPVTASEKAGCPRASRRWGTHKKNGPAGAGILDSVRRKKSKRAPPARRAKSILAVSRNRRTAVYAGTPADNGSSAKPPDPRGPGVF